MKFYESDIYIVTLFIGAILFYVIGLYVKCVASLVLALVLIYVDDWI